MKKLLAIAFSAIVALSSVSFGGEYPDISVEDLKKAIDDKKVTVIDVNGSATYAKGHIPGAIDYRANKEKLASLLPSDKDALIVAYCGGPACSAYQAAAKDAAALGYKNVKHLSAGINGWLEAKQPTESK